MKKIICPAGQPTTIISNFGRGYPQTFTIEIQSAEGLPVTGKFIEKHYLWIFPENPVTGKLSEKMYFHRRWIDGIYSVAIIPDVDVVVYRK